MGRQRRSASSTKWDNLVSKVEKFFFPNFLNYTPKGLDVAVLIGNVGIFHVQPKSHFPGHLLPLSFIFPNTLSGFFIKFINTVVLNIFLVLESQLFFYLYFD